MDSGQLSADEIDLLSSVSTNIHHRDGMYAGSAEEYFRAGLSALQCVDVVLASVGDTHVRNVLDLPSGYGRELRFFKLRWPTATFTACDIQPGGVAFCEREFGARPAVSEPDLDRVSFRKALM